MRITQPITKEVVDDYRELTKTETKIIDVVAKNNGSINVTELSKTLGITMQSLTRPLKELIELEILEKDERGSNDFLKLANTGVSIIKTLPAPISKSKKKILLLF